MKKICLTLASILIGVNLFAQTLKTVPIYEQRSCFLNSATYLGGTTRIAVKIDLPPNTKYWYYSFTTTPDKNSTQLLNLGMKITAAISTGGVSAIANSAIEVPPGSGVIEAYVIETKYYIPFINKDDGNWSYMRDVSLLGHTHAAQPINSNYGNSFYLGFRNPAAMTGTNLIYEVVAVVEEVNPEVEKGKYYGSLGWKAYERGELDKCVELSNQALAHDPTLVWVKFNIALVHLAQGKDECLDEYITAIASCKTDKNAKNTLTGAFKDIQDLELKNPNLKNLTDVKDLVQREWSRY